MIQAKSVMAVDAIRGLEHIFDDLQEKFNDQWDWIEVNFYLGVLAAVCGVDVADAEGLTERARLRTNEPRGERRGRFGYSGSTVGTLAHAKHDGSHRAERHEAEPRCHGSNNGIFERVGQWTTEPNVGRVAHGIPARVDRLRALGNAVVPQIPELIARRLMELL